MRHLHYGIILGLLAFFALFFFIFIRYRNSSSGLISPVSSLRQLIAPSIVPAAILTPTSVPSLTIGLVGDLGLGRNITSTARRKKDFSWSFQGISSWLSANDFTVANLESPLIKDCPEGEVGTFTFCGDPKFLPYLRSNKFIFSLANNHILNYGRDGYLQTKNYLNGFAIGSYNSQLDPDPFYKIVKNGISVGFLSFDLITYPQYDRTKIIDLVKKYDPEVDWLIVSLHWGNEYLPSAEKWRIDLGRQLVDAGADIIHGQHPHVWQPSEIYKGRYIFYSLGNFIFDQNWSSETSRTNIVRLQLTKNDILSSTTFPVVIKSNSQPWLLQK